MVRQMGSKQLIKKFSDLSGLYKGLIYLVVILLACGSYWYFVLDEKLVQISQLTKNVEKLDTDIARFRTQVAKLPEIEQNLSLAKKELYYAKTLLPEDAQALENLLASFEKLGRNENVEFLLFQPGAETQADFYATRRVQLQLSGTFHKLVTYFDSLSRLNRLVSIQSIVFSPVSDFSPTEKYLNTNLALQVYRSLTEEEIKAREAAKKSKK
ncbi:MAG: hypothetical protein EOL86_04165 [Deltaproteobacteria bacterium]|nr:hypothetical protein [Deltaproteobacteria bacterium]